MVVSSAEEERNLEAPLFATRGGSSRNLTSPGNGTATKAKKVNIRMSGTEQ